jgi:hypothetical protein
MTVHLLDRNSWQALDLPRLGWVVPREQFVGLVVHHTVMILGDTDADGYANGDLDDIRAYMQHLQGTVRPDLGADIPYSWVIFEGATDNDAIICEGRGFERTGAHTAGYNSTRWGCALAGDYTYRRPSPGQMAAIRYLGSLLADPAGAVPTLGHRDTVPTQCPGNMTYPLLVQVQPPFFAIQEDDMTLDEFAAGTGLMRDPDNPHSPVLGVMLLEDLTPVRFKWYPYAEAVKFIHQELKMARLADAGARAILEG